MGEKKWYENESVLYAWAKVLLTILAFVGGGLFLYRAAFVSQEAAGKSLDIIVGFVITGIMAVIVKYYWGSAPRGDDEEDHDEK